MAASPDEDPGVKQAWAQLRAGNHAEAYRNFRRLAEAGNPAAQRWVGYCYESGQGVPKDTVSALAWYRRAEAGGDMRAVGLIGFYYLKGEAGLSVNVAESNVRYRRAADAGDAIAQYYLGFNYENGNGMAKDRAEALRYYRLAATQGLQQATDALKRMGEPVAATTTAVAAAPAPAAPRAALPAPPAAPAASALAATELFRSFKSDPAGSAARYGNKTFAVQGIVVAAGSDAAGKVLVVLKGGPGEEDFVACKFPPAAKAMVTALQEGQSVAIRGRCESISGGALYYLADCELAR